MHKCDCCGREEKEVYYKDIVSSEENRADVFVCASCYVLLDSNEELKEKLISKLSDRPLSDILKL